ncbi:DM13 domain-containing protein [Geodermatophilus sp. SYSU D01062]
MVLAVLAAVTLLWFQPQKLLYDERVHEPPPSAAGSSQAPGPDAAPVELASGTFISREHPTRGTARVLRLADGRVVVRLEGFATTNGPALVVWLSRNPAHGIDDAFDDGHADLGPLKGNVGDQNYLVPAGVDASGYTSLVVWCARFHVSFGAADLTPASRQQPPGSSTGS